MAKKARNKDIIQNFITPTFRVSYPHLFKAQAYKPNDPLKFSVTMLFPKGIDLIGRTIATPDAESRPISVKQIIMNAKLQEFGAQENWPKKIGSPFLDGDQPENGVVKEGHAGHYVVKASSFEDAKPGVVDVNGKPITDPSVIYPGCYAQAAVYVCVWEYMGKWGVKFCLDHVQKVKDGKSFGGKKPIEQVFGPVSVDEGDEAQEEIEEHDFM